MSIPNTSKRYAFDTCVLRRMMDTPNYAAMLQMHVDLLGADVHIGRTVAREALEQDVPLDFVVAMLEGYGANVVFGDDTAQVKTTARAMLAQHAPLLHPPDHHVLAYTNVVELVLVTCDHDLEAVAMSEGTEVIDPDKLCGTDRRRRSAFENTVATHSRRPPADHGAAAGRKRRRRNLPRRAPPLRT